MKKRKYAIVDIETTGGMYHRDKITEIAIIVTDGTEIISEFQSLVNPERSIPPHITGITGIDDLMVADAPKFYEIAKEIILQLDGCVFVAHNVNFDYNFIKEEFRSLGYAFNKKKLCTVKLTRTTLPGLKSYGLDNLVKHFELNVENRHRAYDDTFATFQIFSYIINELTDEYHVDQLINYGLDATVLPKGMDIEEVHSAPESPGVYYLSNQHNRILYVGKAKNIKTRIFQHFRRISQKANNIYNYVDKLHFEETGNELIALLLELYEIKRLKPEFNKSLKRQNYSYAIYYNANAINGTNVFIINKNNKSNDFKYEKLKLFSSKHSAEGYAQKEIVESELCATLFKSRSCTFECACEGSCSSFFNHQEDQVELFINVIKNEFERDFVLVLAGRSEEERSFVLIQDATFYGFGYITKDNSIHDAEEWKEYITHHFWYPEANGIIKNYLSKNKVQTIYL